MKENDAITNHSSEQFILEDGYIYVANSTTCEREGHEIGLITVRIPFFCNKRLEVVDFPALCCRTCKRIYVGTNRLSTISHKYHSTRSFFSVETRTELNSIPHDDPSILGKCGYKASLPEKDRISILKQIIDFRVMGKDTKTAVCRFLKYLSEKGFQADSRPTYQSDLERISVYCGDPSLKYFDSPYSEP